MFFPFDKSVTVAFSDLFNRKKVCMNRNLFKLYTFN